MDRAILFRVDAGPRIGNGHVIRCLALAEAFADRGGASTFVSRAPPSNIAERIRSAGHELIEFGDPYPLVAPGRPNSSVVEQSHDLASVLDLVAGRRFSSAVVDHYGLGDTWEFGARTFADRIVAVDDLDDRVRDCDILVDHNWYGAATGDRYMGSVPSSCLRLLGPRYALLQSDYARARLSIPDSRWDSSSAQPPCTLLVSFGGADPTSETAKVLEALAHPELEALQVRVVLGSERLVTSSLRAQMRSIPRAELLVDVDSLASLLVEADLVVGASGSGTWERLCLGVPAIVTTTSLHQSGVTQAFAEAGVTTWLGLGADTTPSIYRAALRNAVTSTAATPPPLVDGRGAERVAEAVIPSRSVLSLREASVADAPSFLGKDVGATARGPRLVEGPRVWFPLWASFLRDLHAGVQSSFVLEKDALPLGRVVKGQDSRGEYLDVSTDDCVRYPMLASDLVAILARESQPKELRSQPTRIRRHELGAALQDEGRIRLD